MYTLATLAQVDLDTNTVDFERTFGDTASRSAVSALAFSEMKISALITSNNEDMKIPFNMQLVIVDQKGNTLRASTDVPMPLNTILADSQAPAVNLKWAYLTNQVGQGSMLLVAGAQISATSTIRISCFEIEHSETRISQVFEQEL